MDVQRPEGSSPTHTLPSLSGGDNERGRGSKRERGRERVRVFFIQGNHKEQDVQQSFHSLHVILKK